MSKKIVSGFLILGACLAAPAVMAATPSFNYFQAGAQHTSSSAGNNWGWGAQASVNPIAGLFLSGAYNRTNFISGVRSDYKDYRLDTGYEVDFLNSLAVYGEAGWSKSSVSGQSSSGAHVEVGVRANVLSVLELRGAVGRYDRDGGFNEYSASVLFHFLPFTSLSVGYVMEDGWGSRDSIGRWQAGMRWSL